MSEYVMVPREPTEAMCRAGNDWTLGPHDTQGCYAAMLAAAPTPPAGDNGKLYQHLLDMLGAKGHVDAGRIIGELHAAAAPRETTEGAMRAAKSREGMSPEETAELDATLAEVAAPREPAPDDARALLAKAYCCDASELSQDEVKAARVILAYYGREPAPAVGELVLNQLIEWYGRDGTKRGILTVQALKELAAIQARRQQGGE